MFTLQFSSTLKSFQRDISNILDDFQGDFRAGKHTGNLPCSGVPGGRVYISGWAPRIERPDIGKRSTIRDTGFGLARSILHHSEESDSYAAVKEHCLQTRVLWEDPDFRPVAQSLYYKRPPSAWPDIQWKRPHVGILFLLEN